MDACTKCRREAAATALREVPGGRGPEALCPACYAAWAEFQLEAFVEETYAIHAEAHGGDAAEPPGTQLAGCRWDACRRAGRLARVAVPA